MPGESYLAVLDALHDAAIDVMVCRNEGGAAMMAEAYGKLTGRPGICFVTRGPGATNASHGVHIAASDSTPMILFVGQVAREMRGRGAFQEIDYTSFFGGVAKWVVEIDRAERIPEHRQFRTQLAPTSGSTGYGVPAAVMAKRQHPERPVVAFAGDGRFMMNGQEFATAVQYNAPIVVIVVDNGMYGTIRMHQEREYPGRVSATSLKNPDFAGYACPRRVRRDRAEHGGLSPRI